MTTAVDAELVVGLPPGSLLGVFNRAGVLAPADVHVARRLRTIGKHDDELVALGAAFAVRAPRVGHVRVDLRSVRETAEGAIEDEVDLGALPWPDADLWLDRVAASPLVAVGDHDPAVAPLRLVGSALYLDRYWQDERAVAADLLARVAAPAPRAGGPGGSADLGPLAAEIRRLVGGDDPAQRWALATAALRGLAVVAGGPGTGKTTTVASLIALLAEGSAAAGGAPPLVALAAPTGKAANRMQEAVRAASERLELPPAVREHLSSLEAATVHRLLGARPDNASRFRHHRRNRLPHDVVVVDETSMLPLWLMARLVEAVRDDARLVFVGDPEQLASVEAGAVLGDIVGPAARGLRMRAATIEETSAAAGVGLAVEAAAPDASPIGDGIVVLQTNHRFGEGLAQLADAIRSGDGDATMAALRRGAQAHDGPLQWLPIDAVTAGPHELEAIRRPACDAGTAMVEAARSRNEQAALAALGSWRLLCAHRRGPAGASAWNARVEQWLAEEIDDYTADGEWYLGRPVIVTANDYSLRLFNGDSGVIVAREPGHVVAAFDRVAVSPSRLAGVETVYAMTVHKAQGSEFENVVVVLPQPTSRILTRELLYTAVTRARTRLVVAGTEESVRAAVGRPIARASGLTERLWAARGAATV